jgi:hypothetical protein
MTTGGLLTGVLAAIDQRLTPMGFRERAGEVYTIDVADEVLGWLGLNRAFRRGEGRYEINPIVGVRQQQVERAVAELLGESPHPDVPPTISIALGYLMPEQRYRAWLFDGHDLDAVATDLAAAIERYGLPFMHHYAPLDAIARGLERGLGHYRDYSHPVALAIAGDADGAASVLATAVDRLGGRQDRSAQQLRRFARAFYDRWLDGAEGG